MRNNWLILFLSLILSQNIIGQNFATVGTEWYYTMYFAFTGDIDYYKIESVKDTLVNEKNCRKLIMNPSLGCTSRDDFEIVYEEDSIVYFYNIDYNEFQILYNYKAKKDSSWIITIKQPWEEDSIPDSVFVTVDSIDIININDIDLRQLYVTYDVTYQGVSRMTYSSVIIERIGDIGYLFNLYPSWSVACDMDNSGGLRCYQDNYLGFYDTGIADSCTYTYHWTGIKDQDMIDFKIFPNPVTDKVNIENSTSSEIRYMIINMYGEIQLKGSSCDKLIVIDITKLNSGLFYLKCLDGRTQKIIKL